MSLPFPYRCQFLRVIRCQGCGLAYLYPRPSSVAAHELYLDPDYFDKGSEAGYINYLDQEASLRRTFVRFLVNLRREGFTGGAVADIGCGPGLLLEEAKTFFDLRMGTEMCAEVAARASKLCHGVVSGGPRDLAATGQMFDLVTAVSVIEHIYNPVAFLKDCGKLLDIGGCVVLVMPDISSPWRRLMGRHWPSFKIPEHIAFYEKKTLSVLASKADMELVKTFSYDHAFPLGLIFSKLGLPLPLKWQERGPCILLPRVMTAGIFRRRSFRE